MDPTYYNHTLERALNIVQANTTDMAGDVLTVPMDYYRNADLRCRERDEIMMRTPLPLVFSAQVSGPNDYVVREMFGKSVLIARGEDGVVRVFENYCRHRGASPASGCGNRRTFVCPYHSWTYGSDGQLVRIPGKSAFEGIDTAKYGLIELPSEERCGFVWAILTPNLQIDVASFLGQQIDADLTAWNYQEGVFVECREFVADVNWKAAIENFAESYHFQTVHGQSIPGQIQVPNTSTHDAFGPHHFMAFPKKTILELAETPQKNWDHSVGMTSVYWIYPGTIVVNPPGVAQYIEVLPVYDGDCDKTRIRSSFVGYDNTDDPQQLEQMSMAVDTIWEAVFDEDRPVLALIGDSVRNSTQDHVIVGRNEIGVQHMVKTIAGKLGYDLARTTN